MATSPARTLIARDLVRVSKDRHGREKSPDDQHKDHVRSATRMGWDLRGPSYHDIGSASIYATKARASFERLVGDLEADRLGANILMMWENSRGSRQESEWLRLIDLAALREVRFWIEVRGRIMDPKDPHDRRDLVHAAADAAFESGLLSMRSRRGVREAAAAGLPHGKVPYGYRRVYSDRTGAFVEQVLDEQEAAVVAELFERMAKRHKLYAIEQDFAKRGIEKRSGGPFKAAHLRTMLINPTYAGIRVHDPERRQGTKIGPNAKRYEAVWPKIVEPKTFRDVQKFLSEPSRRTSPESWSANRGGARHLLSGIARCGVCGSVLRPGKVRTSGEARYRCGSAQGCSRIEKDELDEWVTALMLAWLSDPDQYKKLGQTGDGLDERVAEIESKIAQVKDKRDDLGRRVAAEEPGFDHEFAAPIAASYAQRIADLEAKAEALKPSVLEGVLEPGPDVALRWKALDLDGKRFVAQRILVPEYVGEVRIKPAGRGRWRVPPKFEDRVFVLQDEDD